MKRLSLLGASLLATALLTGCPQSTDPTPAVGTLTISATLVTPTNIFGTDDGAWTGGSGQVKVLLDGTQTELLSTPLSSTGAFSLTLKDLVDESKLPAKDFFAGSASGCDGQIFSFTASNPASRSFAAHLEARTPSGTAVLSNGTITVTNPTSPTTLDTDINLGTILYATAANTITASRDCTLNGKPISIKFDIALVKGWNSLVLNASNTQSSGMYTIKTSALPSRWFVSSLTVPQSLPGYLLPLLNP